MDKIVNRKGREIRESNVILTVNKVKAQGLICVKLSTISGHGQSPITLSRNLALFRPPWK